MLTGWTTDVLDGHLARAVSGPTRLHGEPWDLLADTTLGVGGLVAPGRSGATWPARAVALYLAAAA